MNSSGVWSPVRGLLDDVRHQFPALMAMTGALMAAGALAEGLGLLILAPMLAAGSGHGGGFVAAISGRLPGVDKFLSIMMLFLLIMIVRAGVIYARDFANAKLEASYEANLRLRVATTLAKRGWPFAATLGQAKMQSILSHDVPRAGLGVHHGLSATTSGFMILVQLAVAAYLSWPMALGALALLSFGLPWFLRLARRGHANADELMASREESTKGAFVFHAGLKAALAQGSTASFLTSFRSNLAREIGSMVRFAAALARLRARHAVGAAVAVAILVTAGRQLELDLPRLLAMLVVFVRMNSPVQSFQQGLIGLVSSGVPFAKIQRELSTLVAPGDFQQPAPPLAWHELTATRLALDRGGGSGLPATSFTLARGEWVCVAGQSGAGKTTLIDLVVGLLEPTSGQILVDRVPLDAERRRQWSATLSYVGQQDAPFDDTVRAALGSGDEAACWKALDTVGLAELVQRSPMGLETSLNDRGARLSGGERQRLLIARALLRDPTLLILDEATAALDVSAEREVVRSVRDRYPDMAALLVAHRAETVALCDRIVTVGQ